MLKLLRQFGTLGILILLGKSLGFIRELILANEYGANPESDIAIILLTMPDLIVNILLSGGLTATLIPLLVKCDSLALQKQISTLVSRIVFFIFTCSAVALLPFQKIVFRFLSPGLDIDFASDVHTAYYLTLMALPLTALAAVSACLFNANRQFIRGGLGTIVFNTAVISALLLGGNSYPAFSSIAIGSLIGSFVRVTIVHEAFLNPLIHTRELQQRMNIKFIKNFLVNFSFSTSLILAMIIARSFASLGSSGGLSLFSYVIKFVELPVGVLMGIVSALILSQRKTTLHSINQNALFIFLLTFAISLPIILRPESLTFLLDLGGKFTADQILEINAMLRIGFVFLPFQALALYFSTLYAKIEARRVLFCNSIVLLSTVIVLSYLFGHSQGALGVVFAYGASFFAIVCINFFQNKYVLGKI